MLHLANSLVDSVQSYFAANSNDENKKNKQWAVASIIGVSTIATIYTATQFYRARQHDNIPTMALNDCAYFGGHLPKLISIREENENVECRGTRDWIYQEIKKMSFPPIVSVSLPMGRNILFMNDPKLVKYTLETNANSFEKSAEFIEQYNELLGHGIFASNGTEWKFHRKVASRMFSMRNLKDFMYDMSVKHTHSTMNKLKQLINTEIDISDILGRFSLDTFCEIAFGQCPNLVSLYPKKNDFGEAFDDLVMRVDRRGSNPIWKLQRIINVGNESYISKDSAIITKFVNDILDKKFMNVTTKNGKRFVDASGDEANDILSLFLKHDPNLGRQELKDVALNFIIAGRDTTRMLLSWFFYELCLDENKDVVTKLYEEIDKVDIEPTYTDFTTGFRYLEGALCETLRFFPPVPSIGRAAIKDVKLPNGSVIRKGDITLSNCYSNGRSPKIWGDDVLTFDPNRWKEKGLNTYDQYKFAVFNINPRLCLGKNFAMTEAKVFSYYFLKNFQFERIKDKKVVFKEGAILNMDKGFYIKITSRS